MTGLTLASCDATSPAPIDIEPGSSQSDVRRALGEPNEKNRFDLPDSPFFGPREGLTRRVAAGTMIEEWIYEIEDEELYVWFTREGPGSTAEWLVVLTGRYPQDAVY
jgi:hypothetical protein